MKSLPVPQPSLCLDLHSYLQHDTSSGSVEMPGLTL